MDSHKPEKPNRAATTKNNTGNSSRGNGCRALARAITELVEHGIIPLREQIDCLGQACVLLDKARQYVALGSSDSPSKVVDGRPPWDWFLLHQEDRMRAGVLTISPYRPVPVHDHPGISGILLVLEGHLIERSYQPENTPDKGAGIVRLVPGETRYLDAGLSSVFLPDWNNLHSLAAIGRPAVCLSIHFGSGNEPARNWYLVTREQPDGEVLAVRTRQDLVSGRIS